MSPRFKPFPTPHCHIQSLDTGCLPESFADRELELGTGTLTSTDHGTLSATRTLHKLAKKKGLIYVPGLEGYFRDDDCPILRQHGIEKDEKDTYAGWTKYNHITMHALDQPAYETMVKLLSKADGRAERHGSERKPLFAWQDLEELGAQNITMTSSCLIGMVSRHILQHQNYAVAEDYFKRLHGLCKPGNFYIEAFPHKCDSKFDSAVYIIFEDGTEERFPLWKKLMTDEGEEKAERWAEQYGRRKEKDKPNHLLAVMENKKWVQGQPKPIKNIEKREGLIMNECRPWCPNGDVQEDR
jgi:DNA polymerase III alpha subunit